MNKRLGIILSSLAILLWSCEGNEKQLTNTTENQEERDTLNFLQHYVKDLDSVENLILDDPANLDLYIQRAKIHSYYGFNNEALEDVERVIVRDSSNIKYLSFASEIYFANQKVEAANKTINRIYTLDPENEANLLKLAEIEFLQANYENALEKIDECLRLNVNNGNAYLLKGFVFLELKDTAKAASSFETAREQNIMNDESNIELARLYGGIKDLRALNYCDNAIQANPFNAEALYLKGYYAQMFALEVYQGDTGLQHQYVNMAESAYKALFTLSEEKDLTGYQGHFVQKAYFNYAYLYLVYARDYNEAIKLFDLAFRLNPRDAMSVYHRGLAYEALKDYDQALRDYEMALALEPTYTLAAQSKEIVLQKMK